MSYMKELLYKYLLLPTVLLCLVQEASAVVDISNAIIYSPVRFIYYNNGNDVSYYYNDDSFFEVYAPNGSGGWTKLTRNTDFTLFLKDSSGSIISEVCDIGTYYFMVRGKGNYEGEVTKSFYVIEDGVWRNHRAASFSKIDNENHIITITSEEELALLAWEFNSRVYDQVPYRWWTIKLERDLDLSPYDWDPIGSKAAGDDTGFLGYFDAQGHTIKGLHFDRNNTGSGFWPQGLFGRIMHDCAVNDLTITDSQILAKRCNGVGAVVGYTGYGTQITNCHVTSTVDIVCYGATYDEEGDRFGGVVGECGGVITGCTSAAQVFKTSAAGTCTAFGGIVGMSYGLESNQVVNCLYYGNHVFCDSKGGAIGGNLQNSQISNCYYTSDLLKGCNDANMANTKKVQAYDSDLLYGINLGGNATASYGYGGMTVYPNAMVYQDKCYTNPSNVNALTLCDDEDLTSVLTANNGRTTNIKLRGRRLYKDGKWNTLCLPFDVTLAGSPLAGAEAHTLTDATFADGTLSLTFGNAVNTLVAGTPYIIKWEKAGDYVDDDAHNIVSPVFSNVTVNSTTHNFSGTNVSFKGTYEPISFAVDNPNILFMGGGNTLYWPKSGASMNACRAYFEVTGSTPAREFVFNFGDSTPTAISRTDITDITEKPNTWYDLQGRRVTQPTNACHTSTFRLKKGLYIVNGRKVMVK